VHETLVAEVAVIDASPLIFFARSNHIDLLHHFAQEVWVPVPVADEILQRGTTDITAQTIDKTPWLKLQRATGIHNEVMAWRLGAGESATLALAHEHGLEAIIDDLAGRKCAASLNIPVRGTLGIVLAARQRGIIPQARAIIEDMISVELHLSPKVLDQALQKVGE